MTAISFSIPGKPEPWRRARTNGKRHFKDAKTAANQSAWGFSAKAAMRGAEPLSGALTVVIVARYPIPISASKAKRAAMISGEIRPTVRPDLDNIVKNLDGLNKVAFGDDAQIVRLITDKVYSETPRVDVFIEPFVGRAAA